MTKLTQWMFCIILFLSLWLAVIGGYTPVKVDDEFMIWVYLIPVFLIAGFGIVSVFIIGYRVATFNNCDHAAKELVREIEEAKRDLTAKGFKFR